MSQVLSGIVTVTTAGTAVQGPDHPVQNRKPVTAYQLKGHPDNTDLVWIGSDGAGDVSSSNGFPLSPGESAIFYNDNLSDLWFDADVSGEKICWLVIS